MSNPFILFLSSVFLRLFQLPSLYVQAVAAATSAYSIAALAAVTACIEVKLSFWSFILRPIKPLLAFVQYVLVWISFKELQ